MKSNTVKTALFALAGHWHCAVSFFSPWWLTLTVAFIADIHHDEYDISFMLGSVMLVIWAVAFIPSFFYLTNFLKKKKRAFSLLPLLAFALFSLAGFAITILPLL